MLKKKLGIEAFERNWSWRKGLVDCFKISSSTLIIPEGVKRIGVSAFENCKLEKIMVPKSVERICGSAFDGCRKTTIIFKKRKNDFEEIGVRAFYGCRKVRYAEEETRN